MPERADELARAVVVEFPLRGDRWVAVTSPADRIPSHGTDMLGQRYAFDLLRVDERERPHYHRAGGLRTLVLGVPTRECYVDHRAAPRRMSSGLDTSGG